jgi:cell division protein DivIC
MAAGKSPIRQWLNELPAPFKNRYFLVLMIFFAWMLFFDKHDFITVFRLQRTADKLEEDRSFYSRKIQEAEADRLDLEVNREKYARERYFLKKNDEDVYIILDDKK